MSKLNVAVIGSNGFIAKHLIQQLAANHALQLRLFGRSHTNINPGLPYKKIDFNNEEALLQDFEGIDLVYYLVSESIPSSTWDNPMMEIEQNLKPFITFLSVAAKLHIKKVAFVSSAGTVYGTTSGKVSEDSSKNPFSPYGIIKLTMENFLNYFETKYNLHYDIYRVSNVYGQGQDTSKGLGIINTFLESIIKKGEVNVFGDGESTRNYIYVKDVAHLLSLSVAKPDTSGIYNVSSDSTLSINALIRVMQAEVPIPFKINYINARKSDNAYIDLDNSRILQHFKGFRFKTIHEGISETYASIIVTKKNN